MTAIQFYHLITSPLERALPKLMEKAYASGNRTLLVAGDEKRMEQLNQLLWSYDPNRFLPHGSIKESEQEDQPILLSTTSDPQNNASILVITDGNMPDNADAFDRILDMFDGNDEESVTKARQRWTLYKNSGHDVTYMRQTDNGGWQKVK